MRYENVLKNIDVEYYGSQGRLEYDFVVNPGGEPSAIRMQIEGARSIRIDESGDLIIDLGGHEIVQNAPITYQIDALGNKQPIDSAYVVKDGLVGFEVAVFDPRRTLVIDPVLEYSRYYGGSGSDASYAIDLDAAENIYVIGQSTSPDLATIGAYRESNMPKRSESVSFPFCGDCAETRITTGIVTSADAGTVLIDSSATFITDGVTAGAAQQFVT